MSLTVVCRRAARRRHAHESRQRLGHLDAGEEPLARVVLQQDGQIEALVRDMRERPSRVEGERREHGEDLVVEVGVGSAPLLFIQILELVDVDAGGAQLRQQGAEDVARLGHEAVRLGAAGAQRLGRRQPIAAGLCHPGFDLLSHAGDTDHEELGQVGSEDGDELDALEQGVSRILRLFQHAPLEAQQAQLAVEVEAGVRQVRRRARGPFRDGVCRHRGRPLFGRLLVGFLLGLGCRPSFHVSVPRSH